MSFVEELAGAVDHSKVVVDSAVMESYSRDQASLVGSGRPAAVLRATSTEDVVQGVTLAARHGIPVVARGAGTGLSGGANAIDGCLVISLAGMTAIRNFDLANRTIEVEAGVINADVDREAQGHGLFYPPDPGSFEISTIGGNLATNAGGMRCVKYGVTRASTMALEVVLADGRVLRTGSRTIKNVVGLDLTSLFVGSEGTLGIITAATLQLRPTQRHAPATFVAAFGSLADAGRAVSSLWENGIQPSVLELMDHETIVAVEKQRTMGLDTDWRALLIGQADGASQRHEIERMAELADEAGAHFTATTEDADEGAQFMRARRLAGSALMEQGPSIIEDVTVPPSRVVEMLTKVQELAELHGIRTATVSHAGDGNLHPLIMLPDLADATKARAAILAEDIAAAAVSLGGTVTGEHGVGELKLPWARNQLGEVSVAVHGSIKRALDPDGMFNPNRAY